MKIANFAISYDNVDTIFATNGHLNLVFDITPSGIWFNETRSSAKREWINKNPKVALHIARWHRANKETVDG